MIRVQFGLPETAAAVLAWARESGIVLVDDREKLSVSSPLFIKSSARPTRSRTKCGLAAGSRCSTVTSDASGKSGSGFAISATAAADRQRLLSEDAIAAAPTAEKVTHALTGAIGRR
jgi:hypothetical protein